MYGKEERKKERKEGESLKCMFMYADDIAIVYIKLCLYTLNIWYIAMG